jgi:hypothetical protein
VNPAGPDGEAGLGPAEAVAARERERKIPLWRWIAWWITLAAAIVLFYVILTPVWVGLRALAWLAEFRARRRPSLDRPVG